MPLILLLILALSGVVQAQQVAEQNAPKRVVDFGRGFSGKAYPLQLSALNENCSEPQNFLFLFDEMDWLQLNGSDWVREVAQEEKRSVAALVNLTGLAEGDYQGEFQIYCESCGWDRFGNRCRINTQRFVGKISVMPAAEAPSDGSSRGLDEAPQPLSAAMRQVIQQRNLCIQQMTTTRRDYQILQAVSDRFYELSRDPAAEPPPTGEASHDQRAMEFQQQADGALSVANELDQRCQTLIEAVDAKLQALEG